MKNTSFFLRIVSLFALSALLLSGCDNPASTASTSDTASSTKNNSYSANDTDSQTSTPELTIKLDDPTTPPSTSSQKDSMTKTPAFNQAAAPVNDEQIAVVTTNYGTVKLKFFPQYAPETVKNFVELSKKGFYNGLTFHRVIPGFMIQGGDPNGNGTGGETYKGPGTMLKGEVSPALHHIHGAVAMANRADPDTASSQFYIVQNKDGTPFLDGGYTIFAQAYEGLAVVDAIANVQRNAQDKPLKPVKIEKIEITTAK